MGKCSNCWWWDKSNGECDEIDAIEDPIGEDGAAIVFNTLDDQGLQIWLQTGPNFGCVKFKPMYSKRTKSLTCETNTEGADA